MIFLYMGILLFFCVLALISRKYYSKYKTKENDKSMIIKGLFLSMGETCVKVCFAHLPRSGLRDDFRKTKVVSSSKLREITEEYIVRNAAICFAIVFACNLVALGLELSKMGVVDQSVNLVEREDYQGNVKTYSLELKRDDEIEVIELSVYPLQYSEEEFIEEVEALQPWIKEKMLGENKDLSQINRNLDLPVSDENNLFSIEWTSSEPEYCTSYGKLQPDMLDAYFKGNNTGLHVVLSACVTYNEYSVLYDYPITIIPPEKVDVLLDEIREQLMLIESENREEKLLTLPSDIEGVFISVEEPTNSSLKMMIVCIIICAVTLILRRSKRLEAIDQRNNQLIMQYPRFVNKLCMLLGTGMTIKSCFEQFVFEEKEHSVLKEEIAYMLQELASGIDEAVVYESVGLRLALPGYLRLMNHISQNLRMGTADLIALLEDEVHNSLVSKREYAKKRGEQASTKLLFPMVVLLLVVMVIIVFPAIYAF